jgi:phosphoglycerate dehydrogenase-like enzyme
LKWPRARGYGAIGAAVEARLAPFGVEFIRVARRRRAGVHSSTVTD